MKMTLLTITTSLVALAAASPAPAVRLVDLTFAGGVIGYDFVDPSDANFFAALPIGTALSGSFRFDAETVGPEVPVIGSVLVNGVTYSAVSVRSNTGGFFGGSQGYDIGRFTLSGPTVPSNNPDYGPGELFLYIGIPFPNPLGSQFSLFPYNQIGAQYDRLDNLAGYNNTANISVRGTISNVPEPTTWVMMALGFGAIACAIRRSRKANVYHHFNLDRHIVDRQTFKRRRPAARPEWQSLAS